MTLHACSLSVEWRRQCVRTVALSFTTHYQVGTIEHHWPRYFMWSWVLQVPTICPCLLSLTFYTGDIIWSGGATTASTFCYKNGSREPFWRETAWQIDYQYVYAMAPCQYTIDAIGFAHELSRANAYSLLASYSCIALWMVPTFTFAEINHSIQHTHMITRLLAN